MGLQILAKTSTDPKTVAREIVQIAQSMDRDVAVIAAMTMEEHLGLMLFPFRFAGMMLSLLGGLTILLASIGLYGVVSYAASSRTREVGVRMSLGARRFEVVSLIMRGGMVLVVVGILVGIGLAVLAGPALEGLLFGIEPTDPVAFSLIALLMLGVGAMASFSPALKASRVDPVRALRFE